MFAMLGLAILILCLSSTYYVEAQPNVMYTCTADSCKDDAKALNFTGDVGCAYFETSGVKYNYKCITCNETSIAKDKGYAEVKGCGLSTIIILVIVGSALLVTIVIILALCFLVPACPLAKWRKNQGRKGGRGTGGGTGRATPSRNASKNTSRANLNSGGGNNRSRPPSNRASPSASRQSRRM